MAQPVLAKKEHSVAAEGRNEGIRKKEWKERRKEGSEGRTEGSEGRKVVKVVKEGR